MKYVWFARMAKAKDIKQIARDYKRIENKKKATA